MDYDSNIAYYERKLNEYKNYNCYIELFRVCLHGSEVHLNNYKRENRLIYKSVLDALISTIRMVDNTDISAQFWLLVSAFSTSIMKTSSIASRGLYCNSFYHFV